ncbi:MAG: hypothetical protein WBQ95_11620 [Terracidiphilus sp.]
MYNECRHVMPSGKKCHSPALRDKDFCYHHTNLHRLGDPRSREAKELPVPAIEDASGIQIALTQVLGALNSPYMDTRRAGLLLYGLQIATQLTSRVSAPSPSESVRNVSCEDNGDVLAPATTACEPPADCLACADWEKCEKLDRADEDEFEEVESDEEQDDEEEDEEEDDDDEFESD